MRNQKFIGILAITIFALNLLLPFAASASAEEVSADADPADWYMTVPGVLDSDTYVLYPYELKSLTIGFSKFGELIDGNTKKGLEYDGVDPFASDPYVPEFEWSQGWVINITYAYSGWYRNVWAFALYSDQFNDASIGGDWKRADAPDSTVVVGGRKYGGYGMSETGWIPIGYVESDPLTVLYDGPRRFVALSRTTIYEDTNKRYPLVRVDITFVFNKVKKYVIVFKDIKRLDVRKFCSYFQVEFSNRGEWDLGKKSSPASYAYFHDNEPTCYHIGWHPYYDTDHPAWYDVAQIISSDTPGYVGFAAFWPKLISKYIQPTENIGRPTILRTLETYIAKYSGNGSKCNFTITVSDPSPIEYPRGDGVWSDEPMVFVNGLLQVSLEKLPPPEERWDIQYPYIWNSSTKTVSFLNPPPSGTNNVWFVYKRLVHKPNMGNEPAVPYVIGEWDFDLPRKEKSQFRGVTVYGVVNHHDAEDADMGGLATNKIDREVKYLLDEVFNPWDLEKVVHKETKRWVEFTDEIPPSGEYTTIHRPVINVGNEDWDQYCVFSERVIDLSENYELEARSGYNHRDQDTYSVRYNPDGTMTICGLDVGHKYKILYSTKPDVNKRISGSFEIIKGSLYLNTCETKNMTVTDFNVKVDDNLGVRYGLTINMSEIVSVHLKYNLTDWSVEDSLQVAKSWQEYDFKVPRKETYTSEIDDIVTLPRSITIKWYNGTEYIDVLEITNFDVKCISKLVSNKISDVVTWPIDGETVHILELEWTINSISYTINYNTTSDKLDITVKVDWTLYSHSKLGGRYEWTIVGKDAASVDSVGAALVTAALKNKQLEIGNAGLDMMEIPENLIPWVMRKFGAGNARSDYFMEPKVTVLSTSLPGTRASLKDDWCKTWPVASSNIISIGGPLANVLTSYINDFTDAYYATWDFSTDTGYGYYKKGAVVALPCWSKNYYYSNQSKGYAVISTYKDLNGTVVFTIWGLWGRDTFYACKFFHEDIVYELQETCSRLRVDSTNSEPELIQVAPCYKFDHVTSIVVEIDYTYPEHPTFNIKEVLGTISEKLIIDWEGRYKGGLHPDP